MINQLSKNKILLLVFVAFATITIYLQQTSGHQNNTSPLKIESVQINRLNWDNVQIISDYTLGFVAAGFVASPAVEEKITIHDSRDNLVYEGSDKSAITIPDAQLGSKEKLSVKYCVTRNGKTACEQKTIFASPKLLTINPTVNYPFNNRIFLGEFTLRPVLKRAIFGQTNQVEILNTDFRQLRGSIKLFTKGNTAEVSVPINGETGVFDLSNSENYQYFKRQIQQAIYNGKLEFDFETNVEIAGAKASFPIVLDKGKLDHALNVALHAPVPISADPIVESALPLFTALDCIEDEIFSEKEKAPVVRKVRDVIPTPVAHTENLKEIADCKEVPPTVVEKEPSIAHDLYVPVEAKVDLYEAIPAPKPTTSKAPIAENLTPTPLIEKPATTVEKIVPVKKEIRKEKATVLETPTVVVPASIVKKDYSALAQNYASAIEKYIIRLVHSDPTLSKTTKVTSWKQNADGRLSILLSVDWVDRWLEDNFQIDGILTVDEDGKNATFKLISKNQTIKDLEDFNSKTINESFFRKSL